MNDQISVFMILKKFIGLLHKYMKNECMNYKYVYNSNYPVTKLAERLAESKMKFFFEILIMHNIWNENNFIFIF